MSDSIDLQAWRKEGEEFWAQIQENKLVSIHWNNPWFRLAVIGLVLVVATVVSWMLWHSQIVSIALGILTAPYVYGSIKYYIIGVRTGGLYSFFSETGFGIGCDADRLSFPYSSIRLPETVSPDTVNENYIVLPVEAEPKDVRLERKTGEDSPWDGKPYTRGISSVYLRDGAVHARAYPNEMIVHLFCAIYPLSMYLSAKAAGPDASTDVAALRQ